MRCRATDTEEYRDAWSGGPAPRPPGTVPAAGLSIESDSLPAPGFHAGVDS